MNILEALSVLRNAPLEVLKRYNDETLSTLRHVEKRLEASITKDSAARLILSCHPHERTHSHTPDDITTARNSTASSYSIRNSSPCSEGSTSGSNENGTNSDSCQEGNRREHTCGLPTTGRGVSDPKIVSVEQDRSKALLNDLVEAVDCVWDLTKKDPVKIITQKRANQRDKRLDDILRLEGQKSKTVASNVDNKLLRGAAQRSLAIQYSRYLKRTGKVCRVNEICDYHLNPAPDKDNVLHKRRGGDIQPWVKQNLAFGTEDGELVARSIQAGIKQLVVEMMLQRRLQQTGLRTKASGISALTALAIQKFKALPFKEIPSLIESTLAKSSNIMLSGDLAEISGEAMRILTMAEAICGISRWFEDFQRKYDNTTFSDVHDQRFEQPSPKRVQLSPPNSENGSSDEDAEEDEELLEHFLEDSTDQSNWSRPNHSSHEGGSFSVGLRTVDGPRVQVSSSLQQIHSPLSSPGLQREIARTSDVSSPPVGLSRAFLLPPEVCDQRQDIRGDIHQAPSCNASQTRHRPSRVQNLVDFPIESHIVSPSTNINSRLAGYCQTVAEILHTDVDRHGSGDTEVQIGRLPFQNELRASEAYDSSMHSHGQSSSGSQDRATYENLACGFDHYDPQPTRWQVGQSCSQGFDNPRTESVRYPNLARGFDNYTSTSAPIAWGSSQDRSQGFDSFRNEGVHYQNLARGFDNYDPTSVMPFSWGPAQDCGQDLDILQNEGVHC